MRCPQEYLNGLVKADLIPDARLGNWKMEGGVFSSADESGFSALQFKETSGDWVFQTAFTPSGGRGKTGVAFHCSGDFEDCYLAGMDFGQNTFSINCFHSGESSIPGGFSQLHHELAVHGMGKNEIRRILILKKADILEFFLNDEFALTLRISDLADGNIALYSEDVAATFTNTALYRMGT